RKVGNAVVRNRARRRLKAAAEQVLPDGAKAGHDYVLIGRQGTLDRAFPALIGDLRTALERVGTRKNGGGNGRSGRDRRGKAEI
ncbi:MAG: ribonuclease P protein component, partial [Rhodospirillales bacterium]